MSASILRELMDLVRFPTISADPGAHGALRECADWLVRHMRAIGLRAEVLPSSGRPIVGGEWRHPPDLACDRRAKEATRCG